MKERSLFREADEPPTASVVLSLRPTRQLSAPQVRGIVHLVAASIEGLQPDRVTVLADTSVRAHDLDEAKAMEAERLAKEALADRSGAIDHAKAQIELAQAAAQIAAIRKLRNRR